MPSRTNKKYYFKITIFCTKQNILVSLGNEKKTN